MDSDLSLDHVLALFDSIGAGFAIWELLDPADDASLALRAFNSTARENTALAFDSIVGMRIDEAMTALLPPQVAEQALTSIHLALQSGAVQQIEYDLEIDGEPRTFDARFAPARAGEVVSVVRDITERKRDQDELRSSHMELEKRVAERTRDLVQTNRILGGQVAERERAEKAVDEMNLRRKAIMDTSPAAIIELNGAAEVLSWNPAAARIFGWPESVSPGSIRTGVPQEMAGEFGAVVETALRGFSLLGLKVERVSPIGERTDVSLSAAPVRNGEGVVDGAIVVALELPAEGVGERIELLTQRVAALKAISVSLTTSLNLEEVLATLRQQLPERLGFAVGAVFLRDDLEDLSFHSGWGSDGTALGALASALAADGTVPEWPSLITVPLNSQKRRLGVLVAVGADPDSATQDEIELLRTVGHELTIAIENARLFEELIDANRRLTAMSRQLMEVQEAERRHVGRELHDQIGQMATGLKLLLETAQRGHPDDDKLAQAEVIVVDLMGRVSALSLELRPPMLDDSGLLPALLWQFEGYRKRAGIDIDFQHGALSFRDPRVETAAFRIIQEALTNVVRHSRASKVVIRAWIGEGTLHVQLEDNGIGIPLHHPIEGRAGISGMRERAALVGGTLRIEAEPGQGTCIIADLPLPEGAMR
jgi:PAS domain S-box-containing protein